MTPQQRAQRTATIVKITVLTVGGVVVAPFVGLAIQGLVGVAVAGAVCLTVLAVAPYAGMAAANLRLKLMKIEAAKNPIETLQEAPGAHPKWQEVSTTEHGKWPWMEFAN